MNNIFTRSLFALATLLIGFGSLMNAQAVELGELKVTELPDASTGFIVREPTQAVLIVQTSVIPLSFESNMGVIRVDNPSRGEYRIFLNPGTNRIVFKNDDYLPLRERFHIPVKTALVVKVEVKKDRFGGGGILQETAEIRLNYLPGKDEQVYGGLDGDVNLFDFSEGARILKPSPGSRTIRLNSKGRIWEKQYDLVAGQMIEEKVAFTDAKKEVWDIGKPGALYIETTPPGARVFLNQVEQGITPLDLKSVQPGNYQIDLAKDLYLPESRTIEVKSLSYEKLQIALTSNFGKVKIDSDPPGATVWINEQQRGTTPLEIPQINAGAYTVKLFQSLYYEERETFEIKPGTEFVKTYTLRPQFGSVELTSNPPGAEVTVQGVLWGKTPLTRDRVPSGEHIIKLILSNYFDLEQSVRVEDGLALKRDFLLQPSVGWLTVTSDPPGAVVINTETGAVLGKTPINDIALDRGTYQLSLEKEQFEKYETVAGLTYGGRQSVSATLVRSVGHLQVSTTPQGAKIFLNGTTYGETPVILRDLPTGDYEVKLVKSGFDTDVGHVSVNRNDVGIYSRSLGTAGTVEWEKKRRQAFVVSAILPSGGQFMSRQTIKGALFGVALLASFHPERSERYLFLRRHCPAGDGLLAFVRCHSSEISAIGESY